MCNRKFLLLFLFLLFQLKAFSATFVVTSNADSGPGTLRDALTQAATADSTVINYINFNLADISEQGRTIIIKSQLPDVSTNLVIDGTTQSGTVFGVSDAKIALVFNTPAMQNLSGLVIKNKHDISIFGLYIKNITDVSKLTTLYFWKGIEIVNSSNIQVGASGKGNVIIGFYYPLSTDWFNTGTSYCYNISLKANFFNVEADGETLPTDDESPVDLSYVAGQVKIGGTVKEGNLLAYGINFNQDNSYASYDTISSHITIQNNKIGVDYNVKTNVPKSIGIYAGTTDPNGNNIIDIFDNVITSGNGFNNAIFMINMGQKITVLRNYIGTDRTLTQSFKTGGLFFYWDTNQVAIGSNDPADANYITNCNPVTIWPYTNATVNKNSFFCTIGQQPMHYDGYGEFSIPVINILNISANSISGTATPNSSIELFYSDKCGTCSPQTYFASVTADNNGKWQYNGTITGAVIASATFGQNTSDFTQTTINVDSVKIINACTNNGLGSITGIVPYSAENTKWIDANGKVVGNKPDLLNVKVGKYKLLIQNGDCADSTSYYEIRTTFQVNDASLKMINPSCNNNSGSVSGLSVVNNSNSPTVYDWKDINGKDWGNSIDLKNLPAGNYTLYISTTDKTCTTTYGPIVLKNTTGPTIDQSQQQIQPTNCGQSTGSIANIQVSGGTGTYQYIWLNSQQQQVGTSKDLTGQPAGVYKLQVTDGGQCGPVYSTDITIPETNGITFDESKAIASPASCNLSNGSVTGIIAPGATLYTWVDANGKIYTTATPNLTGIPAGTYTLTASNGTGCSKTSQPYQIGQNAPIQFQLGMANSINIECTPLITASITLTAPDPRMSSFRWVNSQNQTVGTGLTIDNLQPGTYQLYITDINGCENYYSSYVVPPYSPLQVTASTDIVNEKCGLKNGSIGAANITGGVPPYTYTWADNSGTIIGTGSTLTNLAAGNYTLSVANGPCGNINIPYVVGEDSEDIPPPSVSDVQLCSSGSVLLSVNNPSAATTYRLYDDANNTQPLAEQTGGRFNVTVAGNRSYFISQLNGTCESSRAEVKVTVGLSTLNIANTFTPNGDGINDYWQISNIENYPNAIVQVFNRYGQKLFESRGYSKPFDGTYSGKPLAAGVYYYIINLSTNCNLLSGSLTIVR